MVILLSPYIAGRNPYIGIIKKEFDENGYDVISMKSIITLKYLFGKIDIVLLNWYENITGRNRLEDLNIKIKKMIFVIYLKYVKKSKIIVTVHNKSDHCSKNVTKTMSMLRWLLRQSDGIIMHCHETNSVLRDMFCDDYYRIEKKKKVVIPHPNYIDAYQHSDKSIFCKYIEKKFEAMELLFFGTISEYKNIDTLLEAANILKDLNIHFSIVGKCEDNYINNKRKILESLDNVTYVNIVIPENEIWGLISGADCIVLPYNVESVLNSGSVILAMSVGRNIICPKFGTIDEFPEGIFYSFDVKKKKDYTTLLVSKILEAYNDFINNREVFEKRACLIQDIVKKDCNVVTIRKKYNDFFNIVLEQ